MSETTAAPVTPKKSRTKILPIALSALLLLLLYGAGVIVMPIWILFNVQHRNCDSVLSLNSIYAAIYPAFLRDETVPAPVKECKAYTSAVANEEQNLWNDAYSAYQDYSAAYPNGMYTKETHEHSGIVLMNIANDQIEQANYEEALKDLNLVVTDFDDTSASAEAWTDIPSVYTSWGSDLRDTKNFERSEQVLNDFKAWSESNQKTNFTVDAKRELAQTYLDWGSSLGSEKQFEGALAVFEKAVSVDSKSEFESAAQVRSGQRKVYIDWGNDLLTQKQYSAAIEKYDLAVSRADGDKDDGAREALINAHIQWAREFNAAEDFHSALDQLNTAKNSAITDGLKQSVDAAFGETYLAFSKSTGPQARQAMKDALKTICQKHKKPELPIFGLNEDSVRVGFYGADGQLPEDLVATTPGEMHYVACVEVLNHTVESRYQRVIVDRTSWGYYYRLVQQFRAEVVWEIKLLQTDSMKDVADTTLTGGTPPPFPDGGAGGYFYGPPPTIQQLSRWLESVIK
jgi:tetratricopeptide (TPR) repeat protein